MKKMWSPWVVAVVTCVLIVAVLLGGGAAVSAAGLIPDPEGFGYKIGRMLIPALVLGGFIGYFVQKSRLENR
jgi:hypothetical protein